MRPRGRSARQAVPSFSVVTIVRNESRRLPGLLDSIAEFRARGGEVVLLDTGSDDGTAELARQAGCLVAVEPRRFNRRLSESQADRIQKAFSRRGEGPFLVAGERLFNLGAARNHAATLARHEYQLAVDGSDLVEAMDLDFLDVKVLSGEFQILMFETRRLHGSRWLLENRDYFHDRRAVRWSGRAHNFTTRVRPGVTPEVTVLTRDRLRVAHHTEATKNRSYQLAGVALDILRGPHPPFRDLQIGGELAGRGYHHSALAVLLALDRPGVPPPVRSSALCMAASCLADTRSGEDAIFEMLLRASTRDPRRREPLIRLARRSLAAGDLQAAVSFANAALIIPPRVGLTEPEEDHHEAPHAILYWALFWTGRQSEAREHFNVCAERDPLNPLYRDHARLFT